MGVGQGLVEVEPVVEVYVHVVGLGGEALAGGVGGGGQDAGPAAIVRERGTRCMRKPSARIHMYGWAAKCAKPPNPRACVINARFCKMLPCSMAANSQSQVSTKPTVPTRFLFGSSSRCPPLE